MVLVTLGPMVPLGFGIVALLLFDLVRAAIGL